MTEVDEALLEKVCAGDAAALTAVYDAYHTPLYHYIFRRVGDVETARDLTAVTFQRLLQAVQSQSAPNRNLRAWLYRTAHNLVVDHYRRQQHRRHLSLDAAQLVSDSNPSRQAEQQLLAAEVRDALNALTPDQQQVITLKFLAGLTNAEVAEVLAKPVGAVKSLQHRGLAALQRLLAAAQEKVS